MNRQPKAPPSLMIPPSARVTMSATRRSLTEPRWVVGFEVILSAYTSLLSMAAIGSVSLVS